MIRRHTTGGSRATSFLAATLAGVAPAFAQTPALPSAADSVRAFNAVESWVRAWDVSTEPQRIDPPGLTAACVTLRLGGRALGRGTSSDVEGQAIWRAARDAFVQAVEALPVEPDALRERRVEEMTPRITLDLQLAGLLTPLVAEDESAITVQIPLGVEGLAARVGERIEPVFPGAMLSTGVTPTEALRVALSRLGLAPKPLAELLRDDGLTVYRFPVRHLVQPREQAPPEFVYRGGRVVPPGDVTGPGLRAAAALIASHINSHAWPGEEPHGMTGDYHPLSDRYEPLLAPPIDQSACAFSLLRYAGAPGVSPSDSLRATRFAAKVLADLAAVAPGEADPLADPLASAMWLVAWSALPVDHEGRLGMKEFSNKALVVVRGSFDLASGEWRESIPAAARGLIAFALVGACDRDDPMPRAAVRAAFKEADAATLVAQMPWLGWAELSLAPTTGPVPAADALREMRAAASRFTLSESDLGGGGLDLVGGIVFTRTATPLPTWQGLRPLAFFASMLRDERLTPADQVVPELARLKPTLRFLLQLTINDPLMHMHRDRGRALGGVRPAVWDQTAALEPSAMALLCLSETLRAMEARSK